MLLTLLAILNALMMLFGYLCMTVALALALIDLIQQWRQRR